MNHESTQKHTKPVAASTSGVSSEGVGAPQAPIGGDLLGNQDAPVEGRSLSTKNNSERQLGPPFLLGFAKSTVSKNLIATAILTGPQVARPKVACAGSNCPGHLGGLGFVDLAISATSLQKAVPHN